MKPQYPIYIVSKHRWDRCYTSYTLQRMKVEHYIIVEEEQFENYAKVLGKERLLILDKKYQDNYDTFDDLGYSKSKGPGAARNFAWDHAIKMGSQWHWVMDDNIRDFIRLINNKKIKIVTASALRIMEDFATSYSNVAMAGPNYDYFAARKLKYNPFSINTRIYSCNLIRNNLPFRWRGRYNEDTDLSLRILKAGYATIQFYMILQMKASTQTVKGGNNTDFYQKEGTLPKSQMLVKMHPDVTNLVWRYGRWHHKVNYLPFKHNTLGEKTEFNKDYNLKLVNYKRQFNGEN